MVPRVVEVDDVFVDEPVDPKAGGALQGLAVLRGVPDDTLLAERTQAVQEVQRELACKLELVACGTQVKSRSHVMNRAGDLTQV